MRTLLISIHKRHSQNIILGKKTIELRKTEPKRFETGIIYETSPTKAIVAKFKIANIFQETVHDLQFRQEELQLNFEEIQDYLTKGAGWCIRIGEVKKLKTPISLERMRELKIFPPQCYKYLTNEQFNKLFDKHKI